MRKWWIVDDIFSDSIHVVNSSWTRHLLFYRQHDFFFSILTKRSNLKHTSLWHKREFLKKRNSPVVINLKILNMGRWTSSTESYLTGYSFSEGFQFSRRSPVLPTWNSSNSIHWHHTKSFIILWDIEIRRSEWYAKLNYVQFKFQIHLNRKARNRTTFFLIEKTLERKSFQLSETWIDWLPQLVWLFLCLSSWTSQTSSFYSDERKAVVNLFNRLFFLRIFPVESKWWYWVKLTFNIWSNYFFGKLKTTWCVGAFEHCNEITAITWSEFMKLRSMTSWIKL